MYLVNLGNGHEVKDENGITKTLIAGVMSMIKDVQAPDDTREDICFDNDGNLFVPDNDIVVTEDTLFVINVKVGDQFEIMVADKIEDEDDPCECKCNKSDKFYYALIREKEDVQKNERENDELELVEEFDVTLLLMRDDPMAPQHVIGYAREGSYLVPIEKEQFESLEIGDTLTVYMGEFYGIEPEAVEEASSEESAWNDEEE